MAEWSCRVWVDIITHRSATGKFMSSWRHTIEWPILPSIQSSAFCVARMKFFSRSLPPASCFLLPAFCFLLPASCFLRPASCVLLRLPSLRTHMRPNKLTSENTGCLPFVVSSSNRLVTACGLVAAVEGQAVNSVSGTGTGTGLCSLVSIRTRRARQLLGSESNDIEAAF